ncbi:MAG: bifunctional [glutamate--ammonia ligase]-adenylyl-L-tyrosine phosphorylase/[glutamate--ammonia-ligase] adenylyltransferase [Candidimonas sp.]
MPQAVTLTPALRWSGALRRKVDVDAGFGQWLVRAAEQPVTRQTIVQWLTELTTDIAGRQDDPAQAARQILRRLRERVFYTLMLRDVSGLAPFREVVGAMSFLADLAVSQAYRCVATQLALVHGTPLDPQTGKPQEMIIIGMGKLGGKELNVSSDIDLIMLYGEEGETTGRRAISYHEFYGRVTQRMMPILSDIDTHGQVFRTDLRLRPDGDAGPLAWSLDALENYLIAQGREWERYAWLKGRIIACQAFPDSDAGQQRKELESLRLPFVYRKYFDFDTLSALRGLRERIRQDWQRRALARNGIDTTHNIKLGDGGIREIEFVVQLNQLIRGGRMPSLQQRALLSALHKQKRAGVLSGSLADPLEAAYLFLRRVEHFLQYREDEQTHLLPHDPALRDELAHAMGMPPGDFEATLQAHREFVSQTFRNAFRIAGMGDFDQARDEPAAQAPRRSLAEQAQECLGEHAAAINERIETMLDSHRIRSLPATSRRRLERLLPAIVDTAGKTDNPHTTTMRLLELVEQIAPRSAYLALLAEYPETLARVARLIGASPWASQYLNRYPLLLDGLIEWRTLLEPINFEQIAQQMSSELDACLLPNGLPDVEQQMNLMRDVQHQVTFQLLAQDLEGVLSVEQLADQLSCLADMLLEQTIQRVWPLVQPKRKTAPTTRLAALEGQPHIGLEPAEPFSDTPVSDAPPQNGESPLAPPRFAVIAYGKLGGKEIGYASDLDLVFLYDDPDDEASERYTKLGRRMASWLSTMTSSGRLYEIDLRLRPDGDAGLLAVSIDAFAKYQTEQAWAWEHQAITRARFVAGDAAIGARFEEIRKNVILMERDNEALKNNVKAMREKIRAGHPNRSADFDLKHDSGGMVDIEFITQYLVLSQARNHPALLGNLGNIALLGLAAQHGLIPTNLARQVGDAYRGLRKRQHALRLQGAEKARVPPDQMREEREAVRELWNIVLGD